jgi:hypothetical protein
MLRPAVRRPLALILPIANVVALVALATREARSVLRRRRVQLVSSPVSEYARPGWRMPSSGGS